ncbi:hypothetical protein [Poseidonibacter ostreae]|uniref:Tyr recombinase domain-containing protein n=1 Tax=Poseidonibacter ostreae TaxID=2654171 RepID=A0ABQ6VLT2_9BACT|nr:hypothetical protein [Poseidonibacter ostreae]KAB7891532.1 hypothetical protein GBG18_06625 [Poseidonibacter ostreae]
MKYEIETGIYQVAINIEGEWWVDKYVQKWMIYLKRRCNTTKNSREIYGRALDIFLHYYVYVKQNILESLYEYLDRFREDLRLGLIIRTKRTIKLDKIDIVKDDYVVMKLKPLKINTINIYMRAIQWYLNYLKEQNIKDIPSLFKEEIDWKLLKMRSLKGKGGGYGLMMNPILSQLLGAKVNILKNIKSNRDSSMLDTYFPPELFSELLEISSPREQAIYLLCGCAGARIGQALSLTRDDYNYETKEVYIVDPLSDETGPLGTVSRFKLLKEKYDINMEEEPYQSLASKYPIPLQYSELLWINPSYKKVFFHVLKDVKKGNPYHNKHPFVFNTKSGKVLTTNESYRIFKTKIKKLIIKTENDWKNKRENKLSEEKEKIDNEYNYLISQLEKVRGLHSLRHMYAIMWADLSTTSLEISLMELRSLCQFGLGHSSESAILSYFTLRKKSRLLYMEKITNGKSINLEEYFINSLSLVNNYFERKRNG